MPYFARITNIQDDMVETKVGAVGQVNAYFTSRYGSAVKIHYTEVSALARTIRIDGLSSSVTRDQFVDDLWDYLGGKGKARKLGFNIVSVS